MWSIVRVDNILLYVVTKFYLFTIVSGVMFVMRITSTFNFKFVTFFILNSSELYCVPWNVRILSIRLVNWFG